MTYGIYYRNFQHIADNFNPSFYFLVGGSVEDLKKKNLENLEGSSFQLTPVLKMFPDRWEPPTCCPSQ